MAARAFVLFDIDGTLVRRAGPHHKRALEYGVQEITGLDATLDGVDTTGMLDCDLIAIMMQRVGIPADVIQGGMSGVVAAAERHYHSNCPDLREKVCPGVREFLEQLNDAKIPAGLVTGNLTEIGWRKIDAAGLRSFFLLGAFADMAATRAELVQIAMSAAREKGVAGDTTVVSLIGDHPNDVQAAKINGIRSIAVGTGLTSMEALAYFDPDVLAPDLRSLDINSLL